MKRSELRKGRAHRGRSVLFCPQHLAGSMDRDTACVSTCSIAAVRPRHGSKRMDRRERVLAAPLIRLRMSCCTEPCDDHRDTLPGWAPNNGLTSEALEEVNAVVPPWATPGRQLAARE